ncbi:MAG: hypothetical protein ACE5JN_06350 [Candidatus Methylomirabilia bacterium]
MLESGCVEDRLDAGEEIGRRVGVTLRAVEAVPAGAHNQTG